MFKNRTPNYKRTLVRGILSLLFGIACIAVPGLTINTVIIIIGAILIISGITTMLIMRRARKEQTNIIMNTQGGASIIFGLILAVFPSGFVSMFVILFGLGLILIGASQLLAIVAGNKSIGFSLVGAIIGGATVIGGFVLLTNPFESAQAILIFIGIFLGAYGIAQLIWSNRLWNYTRKNPPGNTVDADYEEIE